MDNFGRSNIFNINNNVNANNTNANNANTNNRINTNNLNFSNMIHNYNVVYGANGFNAAMLPPPGFTMPENNSNGRYYTSLLLHESPVRTTPTLDDLSFDAPNIAGRSTNLSTAFDNARWLNLGLPRPSVGAVDNPMNVQLNQIPFESNGFDMNSLNNDHLPRFPELLNSDSLPRQHEFLNGDRLPRQHEFLNGDLLPRQNEFLNGDRLPRQNNYLDYDRLCMLRQFPSMSGNQMSIGHPSNYYLANTMLRMMYPMFTNFNGNRRGIDTMMPAVPNYMDMDNMNGANVNGDEVVIDAMPLTQVQQTHIEFGGRVIPATRINFHSVETFRPTTRGEFIRSHRDAVLHPLAISSKFIDTFILKGFHVLFEQDEFHCIKAGDYLEVSVFAGRPHEIWERNRLLLQTREFMRSIALEHVHQCSCPICRHPDIRDLLSDEEEDEIESEEEAEAEAEEDELEIIMVTVDNNFSREEIIALQNRYRHISIGLSQACIDQVVKKVHFLASDSGSTSTSNNPLCSICCDEYEDGQDIGIMKCKHEFHYDCIKNWLCKRITCPLCRSYAI